MVEASLSQALAKLQRRLPKLIFKGSVFSPSTVLHPSEAEICQSFSVGRVHQFTAGRAAAREALRDLHLVSPVTADHDGVPIFPIGTVGSISHKYGHGFAAVASSLDYCSIGIDLEWDQLEPYEADLASRVCGLEPENTLAGLKNAGIMSPATWILSAKESIYKAVFTINRVKFDFEDFVVLPDFQARTFSAYDLPGDAPEIQGFFEVQDGWLLTVAVWMSQKNV